MISSIGIVLPENDAQPLDLSQGSLQFIGTATVLLRYAGFTILTDPNFLHRGEHVHLGYGLTSKRLTDPALDLDELPPIDFVVLSHLHDDHFDRRVQQELDQTLPIITTRSAAADLARKGFQWTVGLETWASTTIEKGDARLRITALPAVHAPGVMRYVLPPVNGHLLEFSRAGQDVSFRLYLTGDTLLFDGLREIRRRHPDIDLMVLHLGGTRVLGLLVTMDGEQGAQALRLISPHHAVPVHYNDYTAFKSPIEDFLGRIRGTALESEVTYLRHGETYVFAAAGKRAPETAGAGAW